MGKVQKPGNSKHGAALSRTRRCWVPHCVAPWHVTPATLQRHFRELFTVYVSTQLCKERTGFPRTHVVLCNIRTGFPRTHVVLCNIRCPLLRHGCQRKDGLGSDPEPGALGSNAVRDTDYPARFFVVCLTLNRYSDGLQAGRLQFGTRQRISSVAHPESYPTITGGAISLVVKRLGGGR
jgi:hypothetical protein